MPTPADILNSYATQQATNAAVDQMQQTAQMNSVPLRASVNPALPQAVPSITPQTAYQMAAGTASGSGLSSASPDEAFLRTASPSEMLSRYGTTGMINAEGALQQGRNDYARDANLTYTNPVRILGDVGVGVVHGGLGMLGGLAEMGAGAVDAAAGARMHRVNAALDEYSGDLTSDVLQAHQRAQAARKFNQERDSEQQYQEDRVKSGDFTAGLRKVGREAITSVRDTLDDPILTAAGTAEAVGSLLATGPVGKIVGGAMKVAGVSERTVAALSKLATREAQAGEFGRASALHWLASNAPEALAIGGMEGGGAYQGASSIVLDMPEEKIQKSPEYQELLKSMDPASARQELARKAGLQAAAIAAPAGVAAGALVAPFERAPFKAPASELGMNILKETAEEGIQGATGQVAQNIAVRDKADPTQSLLEGVGEQVGQGALYGGLSAGAVQAHNIPAVAGGIAAKAAGVVAGKAMDVVSKRSADAQAAADQANQVSKEQLSTRADEALNQVQQAQETSPVGAEGTTQEVQPEQQDAVGNAMAAVKSSLSVDHSIVSGEDVPATVKDAVTSSRNSIEAMDNLSEVIENSEAGSDEQIHAAHALAQMMDKTKLMQTEHGETIDSLPETHPARRAYDTAMEVLGDINESPVIKKALENVSKAVEAQRATGVQVTPENISTPEGKRAAMAVATQAMTDVGSVSYDEAETILTHGEKAGIRLGAVQKTALNTVKAMTQAATDADNRVLESVGGDRKKLPKWADVGVEVKTGGRKQWTSAANYVQSVLGAMRSGNTVEATRVMGDFKKFRDSQANKVAALRKSVETGKPETYETYGLKDRDSKVSANGVIVHKGNQASRDWANIVRSESLYLNDLYNHLAESFPELGSKIEPAESIQEIPVTQQQSQEPKKVSIQKVEKKAEPVQEKPVAPIHENVKKNLDRGIAQKGVSAMIASYEKAVKVNPSAENQQKLDHLKQRQQELNQKHEEAQKRKSEAVQTAKSEEVKPVEPVETVQPVTKEQEDESTPSTEMVEQAVADKVAAEQKEAEAIPPWEETVTPISENQVTPEQKKVLRSSLRESVRSLAKLTFGRGTDGKGKENAHLQKQVVTYAQSYVDTLSKLLGLPSVRIEFDSSLNKEGKPVRGVFGASTINGVQDRFIKINPDAPGASRVMETIHHEYGHYIHQFLMHKMTGVWELNNVHDVENFRKLHPEIAAEFDAMQKTFEFGEGSTGLPTTMAERIVTKDTAFAEWFADQVARSLSIESTERGIVGKFFDAIAQELKAIYDKIRGIPELKNWTANQTVHEWIKQGFANESLVAIEEAPPAVSLEEASAPASENAEGTIAERFPNLTRSKLAEGMSNVLKSSNSRIAHAARPALQFMHLLLDPVALKDFMGGKNLGISADVAKDYHFLLSHTDAIIDGIQQRLDTAMDAKDGRIRRAFEEGTGEGKNPVETYTNFRLLNLCDIVDGRPVLNRQLAETMVLAAIKQLVGNSSLTKFTMDADDASKLAARLGVNSLSPEMQRVLSLGTPESFLLNELASTFSRYAGLQVINTAPIGYSEGIPLALALETVKSMSDLGFYKFEEIRLNENGQRVDASEKGDKTVTTLRIVTSSERLARVQELREGKEYNYENQATAHQDLIEQMAMKDPEKTTSYFAGERIPLKTTQLHNSGVEISEQQKEALKKETKVPFLINTPMVLLNQWLGSAGQVALFGNPDLDQRIKDGTINAYHAERLNSQNAAVTRSYQAIATTYAAAKLRAQETGEKIHEIPHYFNYAFTVANRMQMLGSNNPQADKMMREVLMSTSSELNLTEMKGSNQQYANFIKGVGQAIGLKVHKLSKTAVLTKVKELLDSDGLDDFKHVSAVLATHSSLIEDGKRDMADYSQQLSGEAVSKIRSALEAKGIDVTPVSIYAMHEYFRMKAMKPADRASFKTKVYFEADGVTNGVINTVMMTATRISDSFLEAMKRGGLYIGVDSTLNKYMGTKGVKDTYEVVASQAAKSMQTLTFDNAAVQLGNLHLRTLLDKFAKDITVGQDGSISITRNGVKKPVTASNYGAGDRALGNGITSGIVAAMQEMLSEGLAKDKNAPVTQILFGEDPTARKEGLAALEYLIGHRMVNTVIDGDATTIAEASGTSLNKTQTAANFNINGKQFEALASWITGIYVPAINQGIASATGYDTVDSMKNMTVFTGLGSLLAQKVWQFEYKRAMDAKAAADPQWNRYIGLSREEINGVTAKVRTLVPVVEHDGVRVDLLGREKNLGGTAIAQGLDSHGNAFPTVFTPSYIGVGGLPLYIQAAGDANMMLKASNSKNEDAPQDRSLKTFDGQQSAIQYAMGLNTTVNEAVEKTWQNNIYQDLVPVITALNSGMSQYGNFLAQEYKNDKSFKRAVDRLFDIPAKVTEVDFSALTEYTLNHVKQEAASHDVLLQELNQYQWSVDQMAGLEARYLKPGKSFQGSNAQLMKNIGITTTAPSVDSSESYDDFGDDLRLQDLTTQLGNKVRAYGQATEGVQRAVRQDEVEAAQAFALEGLAALRPFNLTTQEQVAAGSMLTVYGMLNQVDPLSAQHAQKLYLHTLDNMVAEDLIQGDVRDQSAMQQAVERFNVIRGLDSFEDAHGRGSSLPLFMALASVSQPLREALQKMEMPEKERSSLTGLEQHIENIGFAAIDRLGDLYNKADKAPNVLAAIDTLNEVLTQDRAEANNLVSNAIGTVGGSIDKVNNIVVQGLQNVGERLGNAADLEDPKTPLGKAKKNLMFGIAALLNRDRAEAAAEGLSAVLNRSKIPEHFRHIFTDLIGRTTSNARVYDLLKLVHAVAQQGRQLYKEGIPASIAEHFNKQPNKEQHLAMHNALIKTDAQAVEGLVKREEIAALVSDSRKQGELRRQLEAQIHQLVPASSTAIMDKARQLAHFMMTGEHGSMLLKNAAAIAAGLGTNVNQQAPAANAELEKAIDQLTSLYAMGMVDHSDRFHIADMADTESDGLHFLLSQAKGNAIDESQFDSNKLARFNRVKGHYLNPSAEGKTLVVANAVEGAKLMKQGFERVADYTGSTADRGKGRLAYYFLPTSAKSAFGQGAIQTIRASAGGVDQASGYRQANTAGVIDNPTEVRQIIRQLHKEKGNELLSPVFDEKGNIYAFERTLDQSIVEEYLQPERNVFQAMGDQVGRRFEEEKAHLLNEQVIENAYAMYEEDKKRSTYHADQYINIFESKDPIHVDAVRQIPQHVKDAIEDKFGKNIFMIRKDSIVNLIGERTAGASDLWTGISRWDEKTINGMRDFAVAMFGNKAYRYIRGAEEFVESGVGVSKRWITTVSVSVPWANIVSNMKAQVVRGIPIHTQVKSLGRKMLEIRAYTKQRAMEVKLGAQLRAATNPAEQFRLRKRIELITDGYHRLSIWPLIEAGEFSAISDVEGTGTLADLTDHLYKGNLGAFMEGIIDRMPDMTKDVAKNFMLTPDSALGRGLDMATSYGDFLAKAIYYDDLTKNKGLSKKEALGKVTEEYVNYDLPAGRWRGKLEKLGLAWFLNYPLRTVKVAANMVRENPVHALLSQFIPFEMMSSGVGSPLSDNLVSKVLTGSIEHNFGVSMGFHAHTLTPVGRLLGTVL